MDALVDPFFHMFSLFWGRSGPAAGAARGPQGAQLAWAGPPDDGGRRALGIVGRGAHGGLPPGPPNGALTPPIGDDQSIRRHML